MRIIGRVLSIAGSDSGGGAGIQADIKAITAMGAYAATAITALTAQDTRGVAAVHPVPHDFLRRQIEMALADPGVDVIKTGMLADSATMALVCALLPPDLPVVVDPVMTAKGGHMLLDPEARTTLTEQLVPRATLLTPNLPEAVFLVGHAIEGEADMRAAAEALLLLGARAVLLKGGHLTGDTVIDVLATGQEVLVFRQPRFLTRHTHGTGCTLASATAAGLAQGMVLADAVRRARAYVRAALETAPGFGLGHGPLNHAVWISAPGVQDGVEGGQEF